MTFLNIYFFINFSQTALIPSFIVYAIGFYMRLCNSIGFNFTRSFLTTVSYSVSARRITDYLMIKELEDKRVVNEKDVGNLAVEIENFNYTWDKVYILIYEVIL